MAHKIIDNLSLLDIESDIYRMSKTARLNWFALGSNLIKVEANSLYKEGEYRSFTEWLNSASSILNLRASTLWKYMKIVRMIQSVKFPPEKLNLNTVTGLEQIARIYAHGNCDEQAIELITMLGRKEVTVACLKAKAQNMHYKPISSYNTGQVKGVGWKNKVVSKRFYMLFVTPLVGIGAIWFAMSM